jgi:methylated-DNA-[protein]-cysteine S-methyltransferase
MGPIVKSDGVQAERTWYDVAGWGEGELWTGPGVVLANDFEFSGQRGTSAEIVPANGFAGELVERVRSFLCGETGALDGVPLDLSAASPFEHAVIEALRSIPRGEVVTYGELAALAGHPGAHRAVGTVCARNRFMFLVPCHRVVAAGGIGGYGAAGAAVKRRLLALEGVELR